MLQTCGWAGTGGPACMRARVRVCVRMCVHASCVRVYITCEYGRVCMWAGRQMCASVDGRACVHAFARVVVHGSVHACVHAGGPLVCMPRVNADIRECMCVSRPGPTQSQHNPDTTYMPDLIWMQAGYNPNNNPAAHISHVSNA